MRSVFIAIILSACAAERTYDDIALAAARTGHPVFCLHLEVDPVVVVGPAATWNAALGRDALFVEQCPFHAWPVDVLPADANRADGAYEADTALYIDRQSRSQKQVEMSLRDLGHVLCRCTMSNPDPASVMHEKPRRGAVITQADIDMANAAEWPK
jgi:hypothetical protein